MPKQNKMYKIRLIINMSPCPKQEIDISKTLEMSISLPFQVRAKRSLHTQLNLLTHQAKPACDIIHSPKHWFKDGVKHYIRVCEGVETKRLHQQPHVGPYFSEPQGESALPSPAAESYTPAAKQVEHGTRTAPHSAFVMRRYLHR